jgi:hypothetical protein
VDQTQLYCLYNYGILIDRLLFRFIPRLFLHLRHLPRHLNQICRAKDLVPLEKRRAAQLVAQVLDGTLQGRQEATSIKVGCNNECGAIRSVVTEGTIVPHDGWLGCQTFPLWFCGK